MAFRLSEKEALALGPMIPPRPARKFHNRPDRLDGIHFDSQLELRRYAYLVHAEMAKVIWDLEVHPRFILWSGVIGERVNEEIGMYEADFRYRNAEGDVVEDCKGVILPLYAHKRRIFLTNYPGLLFMEVRLWRNQWRSQPVGLDATS